jgi:hypothetical protein
MHRRDEKNILTLVTLNDRHRLCLPVRPSFGEGGSKHVNQNKNPAAPFGAPAHHSRVTKMIARLIGKRQHFFCCDQTVYGEGRILAQHVRIRLVDKPVP